MIGGPGSGGLLGVGFSLVMTLAFAISIVITRHRRDVSMAPAICLSQLLLVLVVGPFSHPATVGERDLVLLVLLGVGQMGLGLVLFTMGARLIVASEVALITLLEVVLGPFWAWVAVSETPALMTVLGGAVVVAAVLVQTRARRIESKTSDAKKDEAQTRAPQAVVAAPEESGAADVSESKKQVQGRSDKGDKKDSAPTESPKSEERGNDKNERKDAPAPPPALAPIAAVTTVVVTEPAATPAPEPAPEAKERDRDRGSDKGNGGKGNGKRKDK